MSLNWNATKVANWNEFTNEQKDSLIWGTMVADMGEITISNYKQFYRRNVLWMLACGGNIGTYLTEDDCRNAIGLKTNVFTITDFQFNKKVMRLLNNRADDFIRENVKAINNMKGENNADSL